MPKTDLPAGPPAHERNTYFGYLALDNIEHVFERLKSMIGDGQQFAFVAVNENSDMLRPEVRVTRLAPEKSTREDGIALVDYGSSLHRGISMVDENYVTSFGTSLAVERKITREQRDRLMSTCYFVFERGQFQVTQRTGAGGRVSWTIRPVR